MKDRTKSFPPFSVVVEEGTFWHLQRLLQCITVSYLNSPLLPHPFIPPHNS
jgi:hypothetical protein